MCSNNVSYTASTPPQSAKFFHKNENQSQLTADYNRRFLFVLSRSKITLIIAVVDSYQRVHSTEYLTRPVHWRLQSIQTNIHSIHLLNWYKQYTHIWKKQPYEPAIDEWESEFSTSHLLMYNLCQSLYSAPYSFCQAFNFHSHAKGWVKWYAPSICNDINLPGW